MPAKTAKQPAKRAYNSSRRALQAAQTRDEVVRAGIELFGDRGWAGTTLAAVAEEAEVSVETVYKGFASKKGLLRAAMDAAIVGDTAPVPFVDRPEFEALGQGPLLERITRGVALVATIHERTAGVWQALVEAASSDEDADRWRLELEEGRRIDVRRSVERVLGGPVDEQLATMFWILYGSETYLKLVQDSGYTREAYEAFLVEASRRLAGV